MKLAYRLSLSAAAVLLPLVAGLVWWDTLARREVISHVMAGALLDTLAQQQAICEADPERFAPDPRPPPFREHQPREPRHAPPLFLLPPPRPPESPPEIWIYGEDHSPARPDSPPWIAPALDPGAWVALPGFVWSSEIWIAARSRAGEGPCAYFVARSLADRGLLGAVAPRVQIWLLPSFVVLFSVFVSAGPLVRRIRRLTAAIREGARRGYLDFDLDDPSNDEIGELSRAFRSLALAVRQKMSAQEAQEKALREFLANTTHDVAIPLTVLQGHLAALRLQIDATSRAEVRDRVVAAMQEADYVGALLHNLGAAAKLDSSEPAIQRRPVDLGALVERSVARHQTIAVEGHVELNVATPLAALWVDADMTLLEQAVSNIIHNAVRHNRPGGHVAVVLEPDREGRFALKISDDGPGVPEEALARLTERGYQIDPSRRRGGMGLGLHITRRVCDAHDFSLDLSQGDPCGLLVCLCGPARKTP